MYNKTKRPLIQNTYPDYHENGMNCQISNTIVPNFYPSSQFSDDHYHIHHPHHCCENKYPEIVETPSCNGDCGSCCSYQELNGLKENLIETENIEYRVPILEDFPWQETVKSKITKFLPIKPSKGDRYLIYFPKEENNNQSELNTFATNIEEVPTEKPNDDNNIDPDFSVDPPIPPNNEIPDCSCSCSLLLPYKDCIIWYDGKNWNVNRPNIGWTVYIEDEKLRYVYHPDTGWIIDRNVPNIETSHNSDFYYSSKSEVIFAELEII